MNQNKTRLLSDKQGIATLELVGFLILIVSMTGFLLGFWGALHSGVLNSTAARAYAFETFRNRVHLQYHRSTGPEGAAPTHLYNKQLRIHRVIHKENCEEDNFCVRSQGIFLSLGLGGEVGDTRATGDYRNETMYAESELNSQGLSVRSRYRRQGVDPIWSKVSYGICVRPQCGD